MSPGLRINVHVPVVGNPLSTTLPVATVHVRLVIVPTSGAADMASTVKLLELVPVPKGVATLIGPVVAPAGRFAVICVALFTVNKAGCPL
jgi:hypothetical protein